jgi:hypothetical protein
MPTQYHVSEGILPFHAAVRDKQSSAINTLRGRKTISTNVTDDEFVPLVILSPALWLWR